MHARGRARDSVICGAREQTSVAQVAMATLQQSNRLQIASCISFPSPSPPQLSFHGLFASLGPLEAISNCFLVSFLEEGGWRLCKKQFFSTVIGHHVMLLLHIHIIIIIMMPPLFIY